MIATLNNTAALNTSTTLADTIEALFAELDLHSADGTDLVIDELDQWKNPKYCVAGFTQSFNLVVVQGR